MITITNVVDGGTLPQKKFYFPSGEMQVNLLLAEVNNLQAVDIVFKFENNEDLIELLMVGEILQRNNIILRNLFIDYMPYSPQDRANEPGECFSLQVSASVINMMDARHVYVKDPHSDVTCALVLKSSPIPQEQLVLKQLSIKRDFWLIAPDSGSLKKAYKLAAKLNICDLVQCTKERNTRTGEITHTKVHIDNLLSKDCLIVDDMCSGGRTFVEIAKVLKTKNCGKITLIISHWFCKDISVFDGLIDEIYGDGKRIK